MNFYYLDPQGIRWNVKPVMKYPHLGEGAFLFRDCESPKTMNLNSSLVRWKDEKGLEHVATPKMLLEELRGS